MVRNYNIHRLKSIFIENTKFSIFALGDLIMHLVLIHTHNLKSAKLQDNMDNCFWKMKLMKRKNSTFKKIGVSF